jgi:hypothetical protein
VGNVKIKPRDHARLADAVENGWVKAAELPTCSWRVGVGHPGPKPESTPARHVSFHERVALDLNATIA